MKPVLAACAVSASFLVQACSVTLPVSGQVVDASEDFTGTATGYMDGAGVLVVVTSAGAKCEGNFVYVTPREGEGVFKCDDGRAGPFTFVSTGKRGTGKGTLGGKAIVFTFG